MRNLLLVAVAAGTLILSTGAHAQSGQGGYLGTSPGAHQLATTGTIPSLHGSGQGGYLGENPGAKLAPAKIDDTDVSSSPVAWCRKAMDFDRCRATAASNHALCMAHPDHYQSCRAALDHMYFK